MGETSKMSGAGLAESGGDAVDIGSLPGLVLVVGLEDGLVWRVGGEVADATPSSQTTLLGSKWVDWIHPDDLGRWEEMARDRGRRLKLRLRLMDGTWRESEIMARHGLANPRGPHIVLVVLDISEHVMKHRRSHELARLLDLADDAILVRNSADDILYWSPGASQIYGWSQAEAEGRKSRDLLGGRQAVAEDAGRALAKDGSWMGEDLHKTKRGALLEVNSRWTALNEFAGQPDCVLIISTDITEKKQLEERLLHAQRMEGIGTLASGIAHDLNNILAPIMMAGALLRDKPSEAEADHYIQIISSSAERGAAIIRQLLTFGRGLSGERVAVQPRHLLKEMVKIAKETFPKTITVTLSGTDGLWVVEGDPTQLHQVLLNLCVNARDAMPNGGTLALGCENCMLDDNFAGLHPLAKPGAYVVVRVKDTGVGIPQEVISKIFDPFFTTKPIGKGTGLGLSTVLGILKSHKGFVLVDSKPNAGTTFTVYLPAQPEAAESEAETGANKETARGRGECVLVVDDEEAVCFTLQKSLEKWGYSVLTARDGIEAIALLAQHRPRVQVVLTDLLMPNMDGTALAKVVHRMDPNLPVLATSGNSRPEQMAEGSQAEFAGFLRKPYTGQTLAKAIHDALNLPAGPQSSGG